MITVTIEIMGLCYDMPRIRTDTYVNYERYRISVYVGALQQWRTGGICPPPTLKSRVTSYVFVPPPPHFYHNIYFLVIIRLVGPPYKIVPAPLCVCCRSMI